MPAQGLTGCREGGLSLVCSRSRRRLAQVKIAGTDAYKRGQVYGIDVSSGAAVAALDAQPGEHVLDLCCAPGAKLCALADGMGLSGTLTGVDVSEPRLASCRTLCTKYGVSNVRDTLLPRT